MNTIEIASNLYYQIYEFCRKRDYTINQAYVYYECDPVTDVDLTDIWSTEAMYWNTRSFGGYYLDITTNMRTYGWGWLQRLIDTRPHNVTDILYVINYSWGNTNYKFASRADTVCCSFCSDGADIKFRLPITEAWACTEDGRGDYEYHQEA